MSQPGPQSLAGNPDRLSRCCPMEPCRMIAAAERTRPRISGDAPAERASALVRALFDPGHILAATDADRAAFDADRGVAKL